MIVKTYFIPKNFKIILINKGKVFLLLKDLFVKLTVPLCGFCKINSKSNTILNYAHNYINLTSFFNSYSIVSLESIKFKGKGYKLTKKNNTLNFLFNFSHISYFIGKTTIIKKINKSKFLLINWNLKILSKLKNEVVKKRYINIYNYNGLRLKRQVVYKRKGKTITS